MVAEFSLAHLTVLGCDPAEATYIAARTGYDFVSLRTIMMGASNEQSLNYSLDANSALLKRTKTALADTGLGLHDIELTVIRDGVNVRSYLPALETGAELGARRVISSIWTPDRGFATEQFAELCDLARPLGLSVSLEFVTWANLADLQGALNILRAVNRENAGLLIDTLHFQRSRVGLQELDAIPPTWFHFVHLCDAPAEIPATEEGLIHTGRDERLYLGEGGIDVAAIVNRLPRVPYSIETPHIERVKRFGYEEHARLCLQAARDYFAAHPRNRDDQPGVKTAV